MSKLIVSAFVVACAVTMPPPAAAAHATDLDRAALVNVRTAAGNVFQLQQLLNKPGPHVIASAAMQDTYSFVSWSPSQWSFGSCIHICGFIPSIGPFDPYIILMLHVWVCGWSYYLNHRTGQLERYWECFGSYGCCYFA